MKKFIKILIILLVIAAIVLICLSFFRNNDKSKNIMDENTALQIATSRYENLLKIVENKYFEFSKNDDGIILYEFDNEEYFKIENFENTVKNSIVSENIENFCKSLNIIEKNENYYVKVDTLNRSIDDTYKSTVLIINSFSDDEIICDAQSEYTNYDNDEITKISQKFVLKNVDGEWLASEFSIPY